jgi:putative ABC transport system substrate-binding protein
MLNRRRFLGTLSAGLLSAPRGAEAQQAKKVYRVGVLMSLYAPESDPPQAFREGLRDLGYVEGQNLIIDWRFTQGRDDRLPGMAAELVRLRPDVLVADITPAIRAAMRASSTIPIVMTNSADALGSQLVSNLGRPGGNVTGLSFMLAEMTAKRLQLLKEAVPGISRVAVLWNPATPFHRAMLKEVDAAAPSLRIQPLAIAVPGRGELGNVFSEITRGHVDALFVSETMMPAARRQLVDFAAKSRLPTMFSNSDYVMLGGLMSYAPNFPEMFRHAAVYVDKILKGAKPGELPVEQPTKFELVVNVRTAKALGLIMPPSLLARADHIIE